MHSNRSNRAPLPHPRGVLQFALSVIAAVSVLATAVPVHATEAGFAFCCRDRGPRFCRKAIIADCNQAVESPVCVPRCPFAPAPIGVEWCRLGPRNCLAGPSEFDDQLSLAARFDAVTASGPLGCELEDEEAVVRVTITQKDSPVIAQGVWRGRCVLADRWTTAVRVGADLGESCSTPVGRQTLPLVRAPEAEPLVPGTAHACALAEFRAGGVTRRAIQWCQDVQLVAP